MTFPAQPLRLDVSDAIGEEASLATAMIPGVVAEHAARIDVSVLIGYGVVDVSPDPRAEARL
jgi:hypothetical protein